MEQQPKKYQNAGLNFTKAHKVRKTKKGDLMVFINETLVITINKNYALKILLSDESQQPEPEEKAS